MQYTQGPTTGDVQALLGSARPSAPRSPPMSRIKVTMVGTMKTQSVDYKASIQVSGMFGANYPDRVNGHYFWFASVGEVLPKTSGQFSGTIKNTSAFDVQTEIGPVEPL